MLKRGVFESRKTFSGNYISTLGFNYFSYLIHKPKENIVVQLQSWIITGRSEFSHMRSLFERGAVGYVYVFDLTSLDSFNNIMGWRHYPSVPSVLIGTNVDLIEDRVVSREEGEDLAEVLGSLYFEISINDAATIAQCFYALTDLILAK